MLMIQAGKPVDAVIEQLVPLLEKGASILYTKEPPIRNKKKTAK